MAVPEPHGFDRSDHRKAALQLFELLIVGRRRRRRRGGGGGGGGGGEAGHATHNHCFGDGGAARGQRLSAAHALVIATQLSTQPSTKQSERARASALDHCVRPPYKASRSCAAYH